MNGTLLDERQVTVLYQETFDRFRRDHPDFSGFAKFLQYILYKYYKLFVKFMDVRAKIIFAPLRRVDNVTITRYISLASELKVNNNQINVFNSTVK